MYMPFGKYRGASLEQVPDHYLLWILDKCQEISDTLRDAIRDRLSLNERHSAGTTNWEGFVQTWYHAMVKDFHPEKGGSEEALRAINAGYGRMRRLLGLPPRN